MMIRSALKELEEKFLSKSVHAFLLHLNVSDTFLRENFKLPFMSLEEVLRRESVLSGAYFAVSFSLATGITFLDDPDRKKEAEFIKLLLILEGEEADKRFRAGRRSFAYTIDLLVRMLKLKLSGVAEHLDDKRVKRSQFLMAAIFKYSESKSSPTFDCDNSRLAYDGFLDMAQDPEVERSGNLLIILTDSADLVSPAFRRETNGIVPIKISLPDADERTRVFSHLQKDYPGVLINVSPESFASNSSGMSCKTIVNLARIRSHRKQALTVEEIFEEKKKFIENESGKLIDVEKSPWGLNVIGSLHEHKEYGLEVARNMKNKLYAAVPNGILLLGAQGTGKTVFVQAMSYEIGIPMLVMKNTRDMWVGISERNLEFTLEMILTMAPVVVFIDEIDQVFVRRGSYVGDTGVTQRMQARLFRFMSDTDLRGKVLWMAASNLPQNLDPALLREGRFDDKIIFFPQDSHERADIVRALLEKERIRAERIGTKLEMSSDIDSEFIRKFARMAHAHVETISETKIVRRCNFESDHELDERESDNELYYTGAQLETIISRAIRIAWAQRAKLSSSHLLHVLQEDYIPSLDMLTHEELTKSALMYTNSQRFIPKKGRWAKLAKSVGIKSSPEIQNFQRTEIEFSE